MRVSFILPIFVLIAGCTGKDTIVRPHEPLLKSSPTQTPQAAPRELTIEGKDPLASLETLAHLRGNSDLVFKTIVSPLEKKMINMGYISNPQNIVGDFSAWLNVYTEALLATLTSQPAPEALASLDRFIQMTEKNCDQNLRGCSTIRIFRMSANSSRLLIFKANSLGPQIDLCEKEKRSCQPLVEKKYRLLMLANSLYSSQLPNLDFIISYIEHSHLVEQLPATMYLRQNHTQTFNTVVQFFDPEKTAPELRCKIIKNFNIWTYSRLSIGSSRQSMKKLFQLATGCDLYTKNKQLTENFKKSIESIQVSDAQAGSLSFLRKFAQIKSNEEAKILFSKYLPLSLLERATRGEKSGESIDFSFYDEYFYALDRLYSGHISIEDAQQILLSANRNYDRLIEVFNIYVKMQLIAGVIETKDYMKSALSDTQADVGSDKIFERAIEGSESFAQKWRSLRSSVQSMQSAIRNVFETPGLATQNQLTKYAEINRQVRHLPSTIKYIATYPAMMSLAHYLAVQEGTRSAPAWWGGTVTYSSSTIYENMWKGIEKPWFEFSDDESLNKFYLIYAFDYALRSDFVTVQLESSATPMSALQKQNVYFQTLIEKYLKNERDTLSKNYRDNLLPSVTGDPMTNPQKLLCSYELDPANNNSPLLDKNFEDLKFQLHSGIGRKASVNYSAPSLEFFKKSGPIMAQINDRLLPKLQVIRTLVKAAEKNALPQEVIQSAYSEIAETEKLIRLITTSFAKDIRFHSTCLMRLQLVENYYQYLAYESERKYLGDVWEKLKTLQALQGEELELAVKSINNLPNVFQDEKQGNTGNNINDFYFDKITMDKSFIYSRFDIYARLRRLLLTGEIHQFSDRRLEEIEKEWKQRFPLAMQKPLRLPRQWQIRNNQNLEQTDLVINRSKDRSLNWNPNKQEFIREGMKHLRGTKDQSHVEWYADNNQSIEPWINALDMAIYIYIAQDNKMDPAVAIGVQDLASAMSNILYSLSMNEIDVELASLFGYTSKIPLDKMSNVVVDGGLRETLYPFAYLFESFRVKMSMNPTVLELKPAQLTAHGTFIADAYLLSLNLNNSEYRIYFPTHQWLEEELRAQYETISQNYLKKVMSVRTLLETSRTDEYAQIVFRIVDDQNNRQARPLMISESSRVPLADHLVHPQRINDMRAFAVKFTQKTKNLYKTSELIELKAE